jgi:hypothetical protein
MMTNVTSEPVTLAIETFPFVTFPIDLCGTDTFSKPGL